MLIINKYLIKVQSSTILSLHQPVEILKWIAVPLLINSILREDNSRNLKIMPKQELMDEIANEVQVCRKCRLWQYARNPVPGEGSLEASLMLIGEAPGYREDLAGRPFVGSAGKLLDRLISGINLRREEVYISNIVKHRPPQNREPKTDEVEACTAYLDRQIQVIRPRVIATLGKHSTKYILSKVNVEVKGLTAVRGLAYKEKLLGLPVTVIPTFHPAAVLYNPAYRSGLEEDFQKIREELEKKT